MGPRGRVGADGAVRFRGLGGFGLFARLFYGQDYYNIRLQDVAPMAVLGVGWDARPMQPFAIATAPPTDGTHPQPSH